MRSVYFLTWRKGGLELLIPFLDEDLDEDLDEA